jgi:predicted DCC family thiol-disulfide oxidoreductase YuxK
MLERYAVRTANLDSIVVIDRDVAYTKSDAVLHVAGLLSGPWPLARALICIPRFVRDWCYDIVASNRYRWFGKRTCMVPTANALSRFIDSTSTTE